MSTVKRIFEQECCNRYSRRALILAVASVFAICLLMMSTTLTFATDETDDITYQNTFSLADIDESGARQIGTMTWTDTEDVEVQDMPVYFVQLTSDYDSVAFGSYRYMCGLYALYPLGTRYANVPAEDKVTAVTAFGSESSYYEKAKELYDQAESSITFTEQIDKREDCDYIGFFWIEGHALRGFQSHQFLIIEWPHDAVATPTDTSSLDDVLSFASSIEADDYYQSADRYNGKTSLRDLVSNLQADDAINADTTTLRKLNSLNTTTGGFFALYTAAMELVDSIYPADDNGERNLASGVTQVEVDAVTTLLQAAVDNLIPTTQVNATRLYEVMQDYLDLREADYTEASWREGQLLYEKMVAMLDELFDENGDATEANTADRQEEIVDLIYPVYAEFEDGSRRNSWGFVVSNKTSYNSYYSVYEERYQEAMNLLEQYDPDKMDSSKYTEESWRAFVAAYETLEADINHKFAGGVRADYVVVMMFESHLNTFDEARLQLTSSGDIEFSFTYVNNLIARYPTFRDEGTALYEGTLSLEAGSTTLADALDAAGITYYEAHDFSFPAGSTNDSDTNALLAVYLDGEWVGSFYVKDLSSKNLQIPDGSNVTVMRYALPAVTSEASSGYDTTEWITEPAINVSSYSDSFAQIGIELGQDTAKVGDKVTISGSVTGASYSHLGEDLGGDGLTLFVSAAGEDDALAAPTKETTSVTGEDGTLEYVFTRPGWYTVALFDLSDDVLTSTDVFSQTTIGTYPSIYTGGFTTIYVEEAEVEGELIEQYRAEKKAEAQAFFEQYHDYDFEAGYYDETLVPLYETLLANLEAATDFADMMDQYDEDFAALRDATSSAMDHASIIADLRADLALIPSDLSAMDETYRSLVSGIQTAYAALNDYQKSLLTTNEKSLLDQIAAIDANNLTQLANVTVNFYVPEEYEYPFATTGKNFSGTGGAGYSGWPNWNWVQYQRPDGSIPDPSWAARLYAESLDAKAGYYVYVRLYLDPTEDQYWPVFKVDDGEWQLFETAVYEDVEVGYYLATWQVPTDAAEGSSYYIDLDMISQSEYEARVRAADVDGLEDSKQDAILILEDELAGYSATDSGISSSALTAVEAAMAEGKASIESAETNTEVTEARKAALADMAVAAGDYIDLDGVVSYDSGETVGRVHVTIENTTYSDGAFYGEGSIADGWYSLGENDSMMTVILKVLESEGYTWSGTGGTTSDGYDITYLSGVYKNGESLGEFMGTTASGWMGTQNDWFNNMGFHAFLYRYGDIENGDDLHIMFTLAAGEDLGGSWNNNDTRLTQLETSVGTLAPSFSGDLTNYLLVIEDDDTLLQLETEAANKNFQTRIYLNSYGSESARYRSGDTLVADSGDVIYVGVGDSDWPTMNTGNTGTTYTIQVATLEDTIGSLPQVSEVTQSNFEVYRQTVDILKSMIADEEYDGDIEQLEALEARVTFFEEIATFESLYAELPSLATIQADPASYKAQVMSAYEAYEVLSEEQRAYLVAADVTNLLAAFEAVESVVDEPTIVSIEVSGYKTDYVVGDEFDTTGIVVTATYSDGSTSEVDLANVEITGFDSTEAGDVEVTFTYEGMTATITVNVAEDIDEGGGGGSGSEGDPDDGTGEGGEGDPDDGTGEGSEGDPDDGTGEGGDGSGNDDGTGETSVERIAGDDRYATMAALGTEFFADGSVETVVVASGQTWPDALAASALAGLYGSPLVLTGSDGLGDEAASEIGRLGAKSAIVVGGTSTLSDGVTSDLSSMGLSVERIAGANRVETAQKIYEYYDGWSGEVVVASSTTYADSLSAGPYAYATATPVVLAQNDGTVPAYLAEAIADGEVSRVVIVGGEDSVSASADDELESLLGAESVIRLAGENRYQTSSVIAGWVTGADDSYAFGPLVTLSYDRAAVASGSSFPDALSAAAACGSAGSVLLLANETVSGLYCVDTNLASATGVTSVYVVGGTDTLGEAVIQAVREAVAG